MPTEPGPARRALTPDASDAADAPAAAGRLPAIRLLDSPPMVAPCACLPESLDRSWLACASCGMIQAPGKTFCGYCGSRWVTAAGPSAG